MKPIIYTFLIFIISSFKPSTSELKLIKVNHTYGYGVSVFQFEFNQSIDKYKDSLIFLKVVKNFGFTEGAYDVSIFDNKLRLINNYSHINPNHYCKDYNKDTVAFKINVNNNLFKVSKICIDSSINFFDKILWIADYKNSYKPTDTITLGNNIITDPYLFEVPSNYDKAKTDSIIQLKVSKFFKLYKQVKSDYLPVDTSKYHLKITYKNEGIGYPTSKIINGELIDIPLSHYLTMKPTPAYYNPNFILNFIVCLKGLDKKGNYKLIISEALIQDYLTPYLLNRELIKSIPFKTNNPVLEYKFNTGY